MIQTTHYYDEFCRYFAMAAHQQEKCNLGTDPHSEVGDDPLMNHVTLYDVVERKYAGFSQLMCDVFYGWTPQHPYWTKMQQDDMSMQRRLIAPQWTGKNAVFSKNSPFDLPEWLYVFILHRVTGSGINYAQQPAGYHNTIVPMFSECESIEDMVSVVKNYQNPFYTSVGYQFPQFPKPAPGYKRGGDYFLCEYLPRMARDMAEWLQQGWCERPIRDIGDWMFDWNSRNGLKAYRFQYSAAIGDICDFFPDYVDRSSPFYYGSNAIECISYLAEKEGRGNKVEHLDRVMEKIYEDTGSYPYNAEDVCCDFIRWVENYVRPGDAYDHLDRDVVWSSHRITDHPFGRQRPMLELGLIDSFNSLSIHPSDDYVLRLAGVSVENYREMVRSL